MGYALQSIGFTGLQVDVGEMNTKKQTFDPTPISQTLPREAIPQTLLIAQNSNDVSCAAQIKPNRRERKPGPLKAKRNTKKDER